MTGGSAPENVAPPEPVRRRAAEILVVLMVGVVPFLVASLVHVVNPPEDAAVRAFMAALLGEAYQPTSLDFATKVAEHVAASCAVIAAVLWIILRSSRGFAFFGFVPFKLIRDVGIGVCLYALAQALYFGGGTLLATALFVVGYEVPTESPFESGAVATPAGYFALPLIVLLSLVNACAEQLVMTGYLIPRLRELFRSRWLAVLAVTACFATYHLYQGTWGVVNAASLGLVLSTYAVIARRWWPCFVAHVLADFVPFTLAYLSQP